MHQKPAILSDIPILIPSSSSYKPFSFLSEDEEVTETQLEPLEIWSDEENVEVAEKSPPKKRTKNREYVEIQHFTDKKEFHDWFQEEEKGNWKM